jgi:hypothetical protein
LGSSDAGDSSYHRKDTVLGPVSGNGRQRRARSDNKRFHLSLAAAKGGNGRQHPIANGFHLGRAAARSGNGRQDPTANGIHLGWGDKLPQPSPSVRPSQGVRMRNILSGKDVNTLGIEGSAVGFYGFAPSAKQIEEFYKTILEWMKRKTCEPTFLTAVASDFSIVGKSFARTRARLETRGFDGIECLEVSSYSRSTGKKSQLENLVGGISFAGDAWECALIARSAVECLGTDFVASPVRDIVDILCPDYGIGFKRDLGLGPESYVGGVSEGLGHAPIEREEARTITAWWNYGIRQRLWRYGIFRDIYPWNFLTKPHLSCLVEKMTVEEWIQEMPGERGKLVPFGRMSLWELPDHLIPKVREVFWRNGRILDHKKLKKQWEEKFANSTPMTRHEPLGKVLKAFGVESPDEVDVLDARDPKQMRRLSRKKIGAIIKRDREA